jgi:hypothetical protein
VEEVPLLVPEREGPLLEVLVEDFPADAVLAEGFDVAFGLDFAFD